MSQKHSPPEHRRIRTPGKAVNRLCLCLCLCLFFLISAVNLFRWNRPTVSETENRTLAAWPAFSARALFDGSYFQGVSDYLSDTFLGREALIRFSRSLEKCRGFAIEVNGVRYEVLGNEGPGQPEPAATETEPSLIDFTFPPVPVTQTPVSTNIPETTAVPGTEPAPEQTTVPETTTPIPFAYTSLTLSRTEVTLKNLRSFTLRADIGTVGEGTPDPVEWSVSNPAAFLCSSEGNEAVFLPRRAGTFTVSAAAGNLSASCTVRVTSDTVPSLTEMDAIQKTLFYYNDAFYQPLNYGGTALQTNAANYLNIVKLYGCYWPGTKLYFLPAPPASGQLDPAQVPKVGRDQAAILSDIAALTPDEITLIDALTPIRAHAGEYLYYRTDHHWTPRGAYVAYTAFARAAGLTPVSLSALESRVVRNGDYIGPAYYQYAINRKVSRDTIEVFYPSKAHTMRVYYNQYDAKSHGLPAATYSSVIADQEYNNFLVFAAGDIPCLHITVPENGGENGRRLLLIMDSYGRPFLPFLCENYGTIVAVNPRDYEAAVSEPLQVLLEGREFDDLLLLMNMQTLAEPNFLNACQHILLP